MAEVKYNQVNRLVRIWKPRRALRGVLVSAALFCSWPSNEVESMDAGKPSPFASPPLDFKATAYCSPGTTRSGAPAGPGIVAADPSIMPMGTLIWLDACQYSGVYQVMDTGRLVKGGLLVTGISALHAPLSSFHLKAVHPHGCGAFVPQLKMPPSPT